eukprot:PhF_6_TR12238/c0_g1_i1/m.19377
MALITRQGIVTVLFALLLCWIGFLVRMFMVPSAPTITPFSVNHQPKVVVQWTKKVLPTQPLEDPANNNEFSSGSGNFEPDPNPATSSNNEGPEESNSSSIDILDLPMIDLDDKTLNAKCPHDFKDSEMNGKFMVKFTAIFKKLKLAWWLDEGGLIGSSRGGALTNADDDFDFFCLLPNQRHPCSPTSHTCNPGPEFNAYIHRFLMHFWNAGMCINKFSPNLKDFKSNNRLMYSFQMDQSYRGSPEEGCFDPRAPFAHMHLGMLTADGKYLHTNVWAGHTTHPQDKLPLDIILPIKRCRAGKFDAPCPKDLTGYLTIRNRGEYRKQSSDGNCLLVRRKWGLKRKMIAVDGVKKLDECGYNSIVDLVPAFIKSNYTNC